MDISDITKARDRRDFDTAISGCSEILESGDNPDALELRATIYYLMGDGRAAFSDYSMLVGWGVENVRTLFLAAQAALYVDEYMKAIEWLEAVLDGAIRTGNHAFDKGAWLALAFAKMQIDDHQAAIDFVEKLEAVSPKISLPVPHAGKVPMLTLQEIRAEIRRRQLRF